MSDEGLVEVRAHGRACVVVLRRESKLNALSTALEGALGGCTRAPRRASKRLRRVQRR